MEDILFNDEGSGLIAASISTAHVYTAEEIALMLAALGAMVASVVYSFKHIKSSSCLGSKCQQEVVDVVHVENGRQETDV
mgnify:CR=1 FL=1|tara:strand:- start:2449 stop:2688 length:240 start_codon:yes stop_codon:yes gene_type:complete